jgi:hypothetical protein
MNNLIKEIHVSTNLIKKGDIFELNGSIHECTMSFNGLVLWKNGKAMEVECKKIN